MEMINNNSDKQWNWYFISLNPNITMEIINNPDKPWDWKCISHNPNLTIKMINDNPDKPWCLGQISCNKFEFNRKTYCNKHKKTTLLLQLANATR